MIHTYMIKRPSKEEEISRARSQVRVAGRAVEQVSQSICPMGHFGESVLAQVVLDGVDQYK